MPFVSKAQQRWAHTEAGRKALGASGVKHWDAASKGKTLPERAPRKSMADTFREVLADKLR